MANAWGGACSVKNRDHEGCDTKDGDSSNVAKCKGRFVCYVNCMLAAGKPIQGFGVFTLFLHLIYVIIPAYISYWLFFAAAVYGLRGV